MLARRSQAFTLAEVVVASTVTVLIAGATVGMLRSSSGVRERVNRESAVASEARAAVAAMASAMRNLHRTGDLPAGFAGRDGAFDDDELPERWRGEGGGAADRVKFFVITERDVRPGQPESDVKECEFFLSQPEPGQLPALMRRLDPTRNDAPDGGGVVVRIAEKIVGLDLAYHDGLGWCDDWTDERKNWPLAVRIRLAVAVDEETGKVRLLSRVVNFPHAPRGGAKGGDAK